MGRRFTAHDLASYARCPRAWWYERHEEVARLQAPALEARLQARRTALGRRAAADGEVQLLARLLERQGRLAHGRAVHRADARRRLPSRRIGCLATALLLILLAILLVGLWL